MDDDKEWDEMWDKIWKWWDEHAEAMDAWEDRLAPYGGSFLGWMRARSERELRVEQWLDENRDAIEEYNKFIEEEGTFGNSIGRRDDDLRRALDVTDDAVLDSFIRIAASIDEVKALLDEPRGADLQAAISSMNAATESASAAADDAIEYCEQSRQRIDIEERLHKLRRLRGSVRFYDSGDPGESLWGSDESEREGLSRCGGELSAEERQRIDLLKTIALALGLRVRIEPESGS